jgi:ribosomal protein L7/L12
LGLDIQYFVTSREKIILQKTSIMKFSQEQIDYLTKLSEKHIYSSSFITVVTIIHNMNDEGIASIQAIINQNNGNKLHSLKAIKEQLGLGLVEAISCYDFVVSQNP